MKLSDKPCYQVFNSEGFPTRADQVYGNESVPFSMGLTFKERLVIALASNPNITIHEMQDHQANAELVILQADAIIKEMEK